MPTIDDLTTILQGGAGVTLLVAAGWSVRLLHLTEVKAGQTRDAAADDAVTFYREAAADAERRAELAESRAEMLFRRLLDRNGNGKSNGNGTTSSDPPPAAP